MSRIGKSPITIEEGVEVKIEGREVSLKGPKGELILEVPYMLEVEVVENEIILSRKDESKQSKSTHGTYRAILANNMKGVKEGFEKKLELVGVGYRARMEGNKLIMNLGWNHPVIFESPEGIEIETPEETKVTIKGIDKQMVGEVAAKLRGMRKPEPYKGKGIRYEGEHVRRKSAKAGIE
jgi:large subunit ribosomal protein L6